MAEPRQRNGKWLITVRKKGFKSRSKTFRTKAAATRWYKETVDAMEAGVYSAERAVDMKVSGLIAKYMELITPRKRSSKQESWHLGFMKEYFKGHFVKEVTPEMIIKYVDTRLEKAGSDTVRKELNKLSHVFDTGATLWNTGMITNPVKVAKTILSATKTLKPGAKRDVRVLPEVEDKLMEKALEYSDWLPDYIYIAIRTGMRRGEMLNIQMGHLDVRTKTLYIPLTKTDKPRRIPLSEEVAERIAKRLELGTHAFEVKPITVSHGFKQVVRRAGFEDIRLHDLRHEATSRLFERGWRVEEVQLVTGHSDLKSLMRYTHLRPEELAKKL